MIGKDNKNETEIYPTVSMREDHETENALLTVIYKIEIKMSKDSLPISMSRRFSHFEWLHQWLLFEKPNCVVPKIPDKSMRAKIGFGTSEFMCERKDLLEFFLWKIITNKKLMESDKVKRFIESTTYSEFEAYKKNNMPSKRESLTKNISYKDQVMNYGSSAFNYMASFVWKDSAPQDPVKERVEKQKEFFNENSKKIESMMNVMNTFRTSCDAKKGYYDSLTKVLTTLEETKLLEEKNCNQKGCFQEMVKMYGNFTKEIYNVNIKLKQLLQDAKAAEEVINMGLSRLSEIELLISKSDGSTRGAFEKNRDEIKKDLGEIGDEINHHKIHFELDAKKLSQYYATTFTESIKLSLINMKPAQVIK